MIFIQCVIEYCEEFTVSGSEWRIAGAVEYGESGGSNGRVVLLTLGPFARVYGSGMDCGDCGL